MKNTSIKSSRGASSGRKARLLCFFATWLTIVGCLLLWASPATMQTGLLRSFLNLLVIQPAVLPQSQSSTFYLHGTGPVDNPPTIFLNTTAPTATAEKYKDSAAVNRNGGNPWKEIGTWPASASMTTSSVTSLSDLHVWLGLKNSDDQGTYFDLRVEAYKNNTLITSGQSLCITGITRNASSAKEVVVGFDPFSATSFNGTSDLLKLKVLTRVGSTAAGASCGGHNNAVGLRLYFDAVSRSARFTVTSGAADTTAPVLTVNQPTENSITATTQVTVSGTFSDQSPTTVTVNGVNAGIQGNSYSLNVPLSEGQNSLSISAIDSAGNHTDITRHVVRDTTVPTVTIQQPAGSLFTNANSVTLSGTFSDATATTVKVNNVTATLNGSTFSANVSLSEGANPISVVATDAAGNQGLASRNITRDTAAPILTINSPQSGTVTNASQVTVVGTLVDASPVSVTVNGVTATVDANQFSAVVGVAEGANSIQVVVTDAATNHSEQSLTITVDTAQPVITLTDPVEGSVAKTVVVAGHLADASFTSLFIDQTPVAVDANGDFRAEYRPEDGVAHVHVVAVDFAGNSIDVSRNVTIDNTAPVVSNVTPAAGAVVDSPLVVQGHAEDLTAVAVQLNGVSASVSANGDFVASNVAVAEGENTVTIVATDAAGNETTSSLLLFGRDHTAPEAPLVEPIISPTRLTFQTIEGRAEPGSKVQIANGGDIVVADSATGTGLFAGPVNLTAGENSLTVTTIDRAGNASPSVQVTILQDSALPLPPAGEAVRINISSGDTQKGLTNTELPRPLIAIVTDRAGVAVMGAAVHFKLQYGSGEFVGGGSEIDATTDAQGHASARYVSGAGPGPQLIRANFAGNAGTAAVFIVETLKADESGQTLVSGIVLDQNMRALPNVLVRIGGQQTRTEVDGRFVVTNVASGPHQLLELIGRDQIPLPGRWPNITHDFDVLPGVENELGRPLFLPRVNDGIPVPLDSNSIVMQDTTFELPVVAGEAPIRVTAKAGTRITFPPDVTDKRLSVTRIANNRVPMGLEDGLATSLYISVQPSGAVFEQPLEVSFPNLDHLPANSEVLMMSFDHDAGRYVRVGTGHISADGRSIINNPGSGIRVGAWHGFPPPRPQPESTVLAHVQVEGNPLFDGAATVNSETFAAEKRFVMVTAAEEISTASQLDFRLTLAVPENSAIQVKAENKTKITTAKVREVTFSGDKYSAVREDSGVLYGTPHWIDQSCLTASCDGRASDAGDSRFPVAYVRSTETENSFIKVSATFQLAAVIPPTPVKVFGDGPGDLDFEASVTTEMEGTKSVFKLVNVQAKAPLPRTIKFYNPLEIQWKYTFAKNAVFTNLKIFKPAGKTDNRVYVTLAPAVSLAPFYETVLDVSCRNADGQATPETTVAAIWRDFAGPRPGVKRKRMDGHNVTDGLEMKYWVTWGPLTEQAQDHCQSVAGMLTPTPFSADLAGVGTCLAWSEFMFDVLAINGITGIGIIELLPNVVPGADQFMVKNWKFAKHLQTGPDGILDSDVAADDIALFPKGKGAPNQPCVGPGANLTLDTTATGDDVVNGGVLTTGPNGICNTDKTGDDVQILPKGKGAPRFPAIGPGNNGILDTVALLDDVTADGLLATVDPDFPYLFRDPIRLLGTSVGDAVNQPGIPGQTTEEPNPFFQNHYIIQYGGKYYDPSYGAGPFATAGDHENAASDGVLKGIKAKKKTPGVAQITYTRVSGN